MTTELLFRDDAYLRTATARVHARAYRERVRAARDMTSVLLVIGNGLEVSRYQ